MRALRDKEGVHCIVVGSEAAMGALRSYLKGDRSGEGMKLLYAQIVGDEKLEGTAAINIVATPSHRITRANMAADKVAEGPPMTSLR